MERVLYQATTRDAYEHSHLGWSLTYRRHRTVCEAISQKGTWIMQNIGQRIARVKPLNAYIKAISISLPSMTAMILMARPRRAHHRINHSYNPNCDHSEGVER